MCKLPALGVIPILLGTWFSARLLALGDAPATRGEKEEAFHYYQEGRTGSGRCRVLTLDLGGGVTLALVRIPAGKFQMGSPPPEDEPDLEQRSVEITPDFYLGKYEVTRGQFRAFVKETGYLTEPERDGQGGWGYDEATGKIEGRKPKYTWRSTGFAQTDEHPVVNVTWNDADAFCQWLAQRTRKAVRLPTEAEWEYACRAGSATRFYSGNDPETLVKVGNVADGTAKKKFPDWDSTIAAEDGYVFTSPVGKFRANRFGLYDMHGNACEWCQDPYGGGRAIRGSGFGKRTPRICSAARRNGGAPGSRDIDLGFRVSLHPD